MVFEYYLGDSVFCKHDELMYQSPSVETIPAQNVNQIIYGCCTLYVLMQERQLVYVNRTGYKQQNNVSFLYRVISVIIIIKIIIIKLIKMFSEFSEIFEFFRNSCPLGLIVIVPIIIIVSPMNASQEFKVYRMHQFDLQGSSYGTVTLVAVSMLIMSITVA